MKCTILSSIAAVLLMAPASQSQGLMNISFEASAESDNPYADTADAWGRWGNWINRETEWSPTRSGIAMVGYHHWRVEEQADSGLYQDVPHITAGTDVTFSIFAFKDAGTNAKSIELRLEPINGGESIASVKYYMPDIPHGKWHRLAVSGTPSNEGVRVLVIITPSNSGQRSGAIKFDDAYLE